MSKKLTDLIENKKNFIIRRILTVNKKVKFIEIVHSADLTELLLYVDRKNVSIKVDTDKSNIYEIIEYDNIGKNTLDLAPNEMKSMYQEIDRVQDFFLAEDTRGYNQKISLTGNENKSDKLFFGLNRQINRLKLCFSELNYKPAISHEECLVVQTPENKIRSYFIKGYPVKRRKLMLVMSLQDFYINSTTNNDIMKIRDQLDNILLSNQQNQIHRIDRLISQKRDALRSTDKITTLKENLQIQINDLRKLHRELYDKESVNLNDLDDIKSGKITATDLQLSNITQNIEKIRKNQDKITNSLINDIQLRFDEISLITDSLLYDNMNMLIKIQNNFKILENVAEMNT
jgi:hypothetical protein